MKRETLTQLLADRAAKRTVVLLTNLASGAEELLYPMAEGAGDGALMEAARQAVHGDRSGTIESDEGELFLHVFNPPLRLIIIGAVHIAQPLSRLAAIADYEVTVIDPRRSFATTERFPGVTLIDEWPDDGLTALAPDHRSAVVTLTHDPKFDDPALTVALASNAFYVGALGSTRTHAKRCARLTEAGLSKAALARIDAPIGLDIGAKSPAEIAIAIMAKITATLRKAP